MRKYRMKQAILWVVVIAAFSWVMYQLADLNRGPKQDPVYMLYQVSAFQMELLSSFINESGTFANTSELNGLKQAAYSAGFAHERLMLALGGNKLDSLESIDQLMQYILRLQIGGTRALKPEETETFQAIGERFRLMFDAYAMLISGRNHVSTSQNAKMAEIDRSIVDYLHEMKFQ